MPYYGYYGGYGDFLANNIYCILLIPVLLLSLWAQAQVSGNLKRYSGVANRRRITGAQAAEAVLRAHGVCNVAIRPCSGNLTAVSYTHLDVYKRQTYGRKTASIFIMDSDHVILSALPPERFSPKEQEGEGS